MAHTNMESMNLMGDLFPGSFNGIIYSKDSYYAMVYGLSTFSFAIAVGCAANFFISQLKHSKELEKTFLVLRSGFRMSFGFALTTLIAVISAPFLIIATVIRFLMMTALKSDLDRPYGTDTIWASRTMETESKIVGICVFEGKADIAKVRKRYDDAIRKTKNASGELLYKRMMQTFTVVKGYYVWKTVDDFRIEDHILEKDVESVYKPDLLNSLGTTEFLCRYLDDFGDIPFGKERPLWDVTFMDRKSERLEVHNKAFCRHFQFMHFHILSIFAFP